MCAASSLSLRPPEPRSAGVAAHVLEEYLATCKEADGEIERLYAVSVEDPTVFTT